MVVCVHNVVVYVVEGGTPAKHGALTAVFQYLFQKLFPSTNLRQNNPHSGCVCTHSDCMCCGGRNPGKHGA